MAMSGPEHAKEAGKILWKAENQTKDPTEKAVLFAQAQVHATLALLAATVHGSAAAEDQKRWWQSYGVRV